jgi:Calcineurin-like phosphoesterase
MMRPTTTTMAAGIAIAVASLSMTASASNVSIPGVSSYVVPSGFPTSVFSSFYVKPAATVEAQPIIYDPILQKSFPLNLTSPKSIPTTDDDPVYYPVPVGTITNKSANAFVAEAYAQVLELIQNPANGSGIQGNCSKCIAALNVGKLVAKVAPEKVPGALVQLCQATGFASNATCTGNYAAGSFGAIWTQILAFADVSGLDGQYICNSLSTTFCPTPATSELNIKGLFPKPKPKNASKPKASGKRVKVLHLSDFHLDPRYAVSSEANCTTSFCCRPPLGPPTKAGQILLPAPIYGAYKCDTPYDLGLAALQSIGPLTGAKAGKKADFAWTVYTGDLVSHDSQNQLSRAYVEYAEVSIYQMFKTYISGPVFAVLGNHDSNPEAIDGPHNLPGPLGKQFSWNYDHVSDLWLHEGWISKKQADMAKIHYGAYSVKNAQGLRIITLNTDFWYKSNFMNFINTTNPDNSGIFKFLIDELQSAEDKGERVWILGHVLSGWDGSNPLPNPTNLFYQIIDRYSPHVIANVFWGHTHEDQFMIYYANNGTSQTAENALTTGWIGPSVTPLTNLNSGFRVYEVDTGSFDIYEAYTFYSDINKASTLNGTGPTYQIEYSTRDAYGPAAKWPKDAPLNATFWHTVTEAMEKDHSLVSTFNTYEGKMSIKSPNCTNDACAEAKICYMRSGSVPLGRQCPQG